MKSLFWKWVAALQLCIAGHAAHAQSFPSKPINLTVPFAPGASADGIARLLAKELSRTLGQQVIVDNKPGGGGVTALAAVAKATPDGYTIAMGATGAIVVNPHVPGGIPFDAERLLAPVAKVANIPLVMVAGKASGIKSLPAALEQARKGELIYGMAGNYTAHHLAGELLASMAKARFVAVPYRGSAPAVTDLLGGQIPLAIVDLTAAGPHIKAGSVVALGVTTAQRSRLVPDVPTVSEGGVPGYAAPAWMGVFAPAGTPTAVLARLSNEVGAALSRPDVQQQIEVLSAEPSFLGGGDFSKFISQESTKWAAIVSKIKPSAEKN